MASPARTYGANILPPLSPSATPKGAAFLHVRRDRQAGLEPLAISHGRNSPRTDRTRFQLDFAPTPTADPSAYLCLPVALRCLEQLFGSLAALQEHNRALTLAGRRLLCEALDSPPACPDSMLGSLATVLLPPLPELPHGLDPLQDALWHRHRIEVPVLNWPSPRFRGVRIAMQAYNDLDDVAQLARHAPAFGLLGIEHALGHLLELAREIGRAHV